MSWQRLSRKALFENPWFTVFEDHVINPGGGENQYGHVHFKNRAVAIIPLDDDMNTWLVGQDRYTLEEYSWEIPMGGAPLDEDPLIAARRELQEETGLKPRSAGRQIMHLHTSNSITDEEAYVYVAQGLTEGEPVPRGMREPRDAQAAAGGCARHGPARRDYRRDQLRSPDAHQPNRPVGARPDGRS